MIVKLLTYILCIGKLYKYIITATNRFNSSELRKNNEPNPITNGDISIAFVVFRYFVYKDG